MYSSITIEDLKKYIGKVNILDIRDSYLYKLGSIPTAKNVPMNYLLMNPDNYLDKNKLYYIYCTFGKQSASICTALTNKGYQVVNVLGGYNNYIVK